MKITAVETLRLDEFPNLIWVVLEDDAGNRGLGEGFFGAEATESYIHESAAALLVGQEITGPEELRRRLRPYVGHQAPGAEIHGNSAIDIALWDLWGQRAQAPLWELMGGHSRERIRAYNTCAGYRYNPRGRGPADRQLGAGGQAGSL